MLLRAQQLAACSDKLRSGPLHLVCKLPTVEVDLQRIGYDPLRSIHVDCDLSAPIVQWLRTLPDLPGALIVLTRLTCKLVPAVPICRSASCIPTVSETLLERPVHRADARGEHENNPAGPDLDCIPPGFQGCGAVLEKRLASLEDTTGRCELRGLAKAVGSAPKCKPWLSQTRAGRNSGDLVTFSELLWSWHHLLVKTLHSAPCILTPSTTLLGMELMSVGSRRARKQSGRAGSGLQSSLFPRLRGCAGEEAGKPRRHNRQMRATRFGQSSEFGSPRQALAPSNEMGPQLR